MVNLKKEKGRNGFWYKINSKEWQGRKLAVLGGSSGKGERFCAYRERLTGQGIEEHAPRGVKR